MGEMSFLHVEDLHNILCLALFLCFIYDMHVVTVIALSEQQATSFLRSKLENYGSLSAGKQGASTLGTSRWKFL